MVGKEYLVALEGLARKQQRIFPDACDRGIWETPAVRDEILTALKGLKELEGGEAFRYHFGASYATRLAVEVDEGMTCGYKFNVGRHVVCRGPNHGKAFYSINITAARW